MNERDEHKVPTLSQRGAILTVVLSLACVLCIPILPMLGKETKEQEQQKLRQMGESVLQRLYRLEPDARQALVNSAGYAVFSNRALKIISAGSGRGKGLAINNRTKEETFMEMIELQGGLGSGVKKLSIIFVFENENAFSTFVNSGSEVWSQNTTAEKSGKQEFSMQGARPVSPGIWVYQLMDSRLAVELTETGAKYYKDGDLN